MFSSARSLTQTPKALNNGPKPYHKVGILSNVGCIVEDIVSAIKVGRIITGIPLFGAHVPKHVRSGMLKDFKTVIIWLDRDKYKESLKIRRQFQAFHPDVHVISTEDDPKDLPMTIIRQHIEPCIKFNRPRDTYTDT